MGVAHAPIGQHAASPAELAEQLTADRRGEPYLLFRDGGGVQRIVTAGLGSARLGIGRGPACDVALTWDEEVSRVHAQLERVGDDWILVDDGLSRNGTWLNGERLTGRRRMHHGDVVRVGATEIAFRSPRRADVKTVVAQRLPPPQLSQAQRRVLIALCRPYHQGGAFAMPASNRQIADELVLSIDGVKTHVRALFERFGVGDLPQNRKRARLVELAFETGAVTARDLES
jgi:DNA-binding CsgD family transcriptional regulator